MTRGEKAFIGVKVIHSADSTGSLLRISSHEDENSVALNSNYITDQIGVENYLKVWAASPWQPAAEGQVQRLSYATIGFLCPTPAPTPQPTYSTEPTSKPTTVRHYTVVQEGY